MKKELLIQILKTSPKEIIIKVILSIINGLALPLTMFLTQNIIDSITVSVKWSFIYLLLLALVFIGFVLSENYDAYLDIQISNQIEIVFGKDILIRCSKIAYENYESSDTYNIIGRIMTKYKTTAIGLISLMSAVIKIFTMFLGIFYYLFFVKWWIFPVMIFSLSPVFYLTIHTSLKEYDAFSTYYPYLRKAQYFSGLITKRSSIREARLFQYNKFVEGLWEVSLKNFQNRQINDNISSRFLAGICVLFQYMMTVFNLYIVYPSVANGTVSIGVYLALAQAMWSFVGEFQYQVIGIIKKMVDFKKFTKEYDTFKQLTIYSLQGEIYEKNSSFHFIQLKDVWFKYGENNPYVLKGINFSMECNKVIGLVGENGSGKSTLIKLLLGLLEPTKGTILLDNVIITNENRYLLRGLSSVIFQEYGKYNLTFRESVALSDIRNLNNTEKIKMVVKSICKKNSIFDMLCGDVDTKLGKERWNGQDLSGGQWQMVALARALFSNKPIIILDEPTAALDPISELDVYKLIYDNREKGTALLATHRLGAILMADKIYLVDNGVVIEEGTHLELMSRGGKYEKMFNTQKNWYQNNSI